jgi:hypothetical protein
VALGDGVQDTRGDRCFEVQGLHHSDNLIKKLYRPFDGELGETVLPMDDAKTDLRLREI